MYFPIFDCYVSLPEGKPVTPLRVGYFSGSMLNFGGRKVGATRIF